MTMITSSLTDALRLDFLHACSELAEARRQQRAKDTPANRAAVAESRARIDAVLDMYLESTHQRFSDELGTLVQPGFTGGHVLSPGPLPPAENPTTVREEPGTTPRS